MDQAVSTLMESLKAWNRCQDFIRWSKKAQIQEQQETYQRMAAVWRMNHEILQAEYWQKIRA